MVTAKFSNFFFFHAFFTVSVRIKYKKGIGEDTPPSPLSPFQHAFIMLLMYRHEKQRKHFIQRKKSFSFSNIYYFTKQKCIFCCLQVFPGWEMFVIVC